MSELISGQSRNRVIDALAYGYSEILLREGGVTLLPAAAIKVGAQVLVAMEGWLRSGGFNEHMDDRGLWDSWDQLVATRGWAPPSGRAGYHWLPRVQQVSLTGTSERIALPAADPSGVVAGLSADRVALIVAAAVEAAVSRPEETSVVVESTGADGKTKKSYVTTRRRVIEP